VASLAAHATFAVLALRPHHPVTPSAEVAPVTEPLPRPDDRGLLGSTFEIPAPENESPSQVEPAGGGGSSNAGEAAGAPPGETPKPESDSPEKPAKPRAPAGKSGSGKEGGEAAAAKPAGTADGTGEGTGPAVYGAAGDRSAVDLATAITRGFPQAASADPSWASAPMGPAGDVTLTLTLDESGKLVGSDVSPGASAPLAAGIRRTLALVGGRAFTSRGKVTRLHLVATVSPDTVHDGLHGDVFAIGGSYTGSEGQAFFALAIGRRVDLKVRPR
jgi:hypothetical protein